ncbi:MAG: DUF58 domain-containing protein [Actinomycetota bacterium]
MTAAWGQRSIGDLGDGARRRFFVEGDVHVGRRQLVPTPAGLTVLTVVVLLLGATLPLDDRRPAGLLAGAVLLVLADTIVASRWLGDPAISATAPELASTDAPVELDVEVSEPAEMAVEVEVRDFGVSGQTGDDGRATLRVPVPAPSVFHFEALRVGVTGPFGLGRCRRNVTLRSRRPTHVVPPPADDVGLPLDRMLRLDDDPVDVIGLREGRAGSPLRDVHWPSSLRTGRLIVRERAPIDPGLVRIAVAIPRADVARVRRVVATARSVATTALRHGARVELSSVASQPPPVGMTLHADLARGASFLDDGPVRIETTTVRELDRRLATLVPGEVEAPPTPYVLVDVNGAVWVDS